MLRAALSHALRLGLVSRNVATLAEAPRVDSKPAEFLSADEARALLDVAKEDRHFALWVVVVMLGLRRGELAGLRWSAIDLEAGTLRVEQQVQRELLAHPEFTFSSLVVRRIPNGVCLEGVVETNTDLANVTRLLQSVAGVEEVLNHLVVRHPPAKG